MGKYLKKFELTSQYEEYINSIMALLPNVSLIKNKIHYNPVPNYEEEYFTIENIDSYNGTLQIDINDKYQTLIENLSYNSYFKEFSLGKILYGEFLRILIKKGKKSVSLGQANLDYKKHYGTNIYNVRNMIVYKNSFYKFLYSSLKFINKTKSCVKRFFRQS